jgi:4-diphosphocytidyl-2-C-methyl-D-erythritol kinase
MICFPNAKINIGLNIVEKRNDGFHNLETIFFPIGLKDALEFIESDTLQFENSGLTIDGDPLNNLCVKAWKLIQKDFNIPPVHIHLHKVIPFGAGLGGGSADAAFMLKLLNDYFKLNISEEKLIHYALTLGSDCPIFIKNEACYGTGRGEILEPITVHLTGKFLVLINLGIHVPTRDAFASIIPQHSKFDLRESIQMPITDWKDRIYNDFEKSIFPKYPAIAKIKDTLYEQGALYAAMSGSGSSVFGIFEKEPDLQDLFSDSFCWCGNL